jgi:hypothetical protein
LQRDSAIDESLEMLGQGKRLKPQKGCAKGFTILHTLSDETDYYYIIKNLENLKSRKFAGMPRLRRFVCENVFFI